jgi:hypothetical protein
VYTEHGYFLERVFFDEMFWEECFDHLSFFWKNYVAYELIHGSLSLCVEKVAPISTEHNYSNFGPNKSASIAGQAGKGKPPFKQSILPRVYLCSVCTKETVSKPERFEDQSIYCWQCTNWCHLSCGSVTQEDIDFVIANTQWKCPNCL